MLTPASSRPLIVWFRDDLRLADHPALHAAAQSGAPVLCVYVLDEVSDDVRALGGAVRWWLAQSLRALESELRALGGALILRRGPTAAVLAELAQQHDAAAVHWNEIEIAAHRAVADALADALTVAGIAYHRHRGDTLVEPSAIRSKDGRGMRVFTPFWRRVLSLGDPPQPLPRPTTLRPAPAVPTEQLSDWQLEPTAPDWAGGLRQTWTPGEAAAQTRLAAFLAMQPGYAEGRDYPDRHITSGLSPHLRFGEISPRQVWYAARFAAAERPAIAPDIDKFLSEVGWREFCRHLLFDHPDLASRNLQPAFDAFPWQSDDAVLTAWQRGRTGYPIVDAGMRELWHSGVMHNRVRMVVGSFLVKHLLIDWRLGEQWFWDTLVDADPGSNPGNWQWVAGCGADAAPYFRVFNPVLQSEKFDAGGAYIRRWVPELARLPNDLIHQPWTATPLELAAAGIKLGGNYPGPIVDHKTGRQRALSAYAELRQR
ncbi:Deoxyribodipyrimidine photo-lyase [Rhodopseudomonas palustris]|uniref:Deoxyribodipyrimidine photo-lyase n=1 Tax=Rhodopseudomonas palustris (strain ATCC BAA-98 / CGA009) TaxID=258594 RepID=Q6N504_RHOPA|nr:deoxyribodipyrimidine photo-lyase [Rhodopseudomonas palustris]OPF93758.1 deoxyribodipyrimidine photo-lyase [Rhodopseudomonas palustris]QQM04712.1 Deoxyribodipyrimidine photo-lyase [Rhodopseudomonas palustris]RJF66337.1 deoxyribodipyrimidine photo-lyase [Rhodopseudomonas palustris]WAB76086.1 deoxyribodipyrimidine photo-lyase [Rhodopseudomonas palustris]WCL93345.1 deoxyribodipyrimidine photo-lyase [Rhodopseudomonas palustris CGA009]